MNKLPIFHLYRHILNSSLFYHIKFTLGKKIEFEQSNILYADKLFEHVKINL